MGNKTPGRPLAELSAEQQRLVRRTEARITRAQAQLEQAQHDLARLAQDYGTSAVARQLGVSRQVMHKRLRRAAI